MRDLMNNSKLTTLIMVLLNLWFGFELIVNTHEVPIFVIKLLGLLWVYDGTLYALVLIKRIKVDGKS